MEVKRRKYNYFVILGGRQWLTWNGYVALCKDREGRPILEHRLVMEKHLGRSLTRTEIVHHIDGNRQHNILENLELTNRTEHMALHSIDYEKDEKGRYT